MAVFMTGLGLLQSNLGFVNQGGNFWDSTQWETIPRPFLDNHGLAYVSAVAAWIRGDKDPEWTNDLPGDVRKPMRKTLKYLFRTNDCFFQPSTTQSLAGRSPHDWLQEVSGKSKSAKIIAMRHLECNDANRSQVENPLLHHLKSGDRIMQLHSLAAIDRLQMDSDPTVEELRMLVTLRDDEIRAKAMLTLARMQQLDDNTIDVAGRMLDSHARHVVFA
ncbi:MAG: hypothetical protein ACR2NP_02910, partial [Pirellulaceae bacterium]